MSDLIFSLQMCNLFAQNMRLTYHMNASYKKTTGCSCQQQGSVTVYQHYHYDIFNSIIDFQMEELNSRFSDGTMELFILSSALPIVFGSHIESTLI